MQSYRLPHDYTQPNKKTTQVAVHLFLEIMLKFAFPWILHSDNKMEFKSQLIEHLPQHQSIKKTYISPWHPKANGKLESSHRFLKDYIWEILHRQYSKMGWTNTICNCCMYLASQQALTGIPLFLYFRWEPYLPHIAAFYSQNLGTLAHMKAWPIWIS